MQNLSGDETAMSDIASLQDAIETARTAYMRASEQHARSRKHAMSLIHIVEEQLREKRIELSQNDIQRERMTHEHGQLRQMLHNLVMAVEVGSAESQDIDPTAIEVRPDKVTPLAPVAVASEPIEPASEAVIESKSRRTSGTADSAKTDDGAEAEEVRAGLKRMLKKKRIPANGLNAVQTEITEAPAPAE
jgi:hypothetical protein